MDRRLTWIRILLGSLALAIILGAFGAHGLVDRVSPSRLGTWETAHHYHVIASLVLLIFATSSARWSVPLWSQWALFLGSLVFSGSLYLLVVLDQGWLGAVTPLGGLAMIIGLFGAAAGCRRANSPPSP